nr:MAG TPA: hypothetical protein [Caudoviricetes sp.]
MFSFSILQQKSLFDSHCPLHAEKHRGSSEPRCFWFILLFPL